MSSSLAIRVLHVDDDPELADTVAALLERENDRFDVGVETDVDRGLDRIDDSDVDCVVSDYDMPERNGIEFLEAVREIRPDLPFVLYTGKGSEEIASRAISAGVTDYLQKGGETSQYAVLANRIVNAVEQYRSKREAEASRKRLSLFVEQSPLGVIEWDEEFDVVRINEAAEAILGYTEDELHGCSWEAIVPDSDRTGVAEVVSNLLDAEGGYHSVNENVREDGERIVCEWHNRVVTDENDDVVAVFSQFQDVTERRERERELQRYERMVNTMREAACIYDEDGRFELVNEYLAEFYGTTREALEGKQSSLIPAIRAEHEGDPYQEIFDGTREEIRGEIEGEFSGEGREVLAYRLTPLVIDGTVEGTVGVARDVTERKERERALQRERDRLEEFAGVVSHDLRNPLHVASGRLELAREKCDSNHHDAIATAIDRMERLVDDVLWLAREGRDVGTIEPVDFRSEVEAAWTIAQGDAGDAELIVDEGTERTIDADPDRFRQLLENLLGNAIEHGGDGVRVCVEPVDGGFAVEDDGPGIPDSERAKVFDAGYSSAEDGTGFGLAIVEQVADAHGWDVSVRSGSDGGARFEITGVESDAGA